MADRAFLEDAAGAARPGPAGDDHRVELAAGILAAVGVVYFLVASSTVIISGRPRAALALLSLFSCRESQRIIRERR